MKTSNWNSFIQFIVLNLSGLIKFLLKLQSKSILPYSVQPPTSKVQDISILTDGENVNVKSNNSSNSPVVFES